jgi:hypothetical protein
VEDFEEEELARDEAEMSTLLTTQEIIDAISFVNEGSEDELFSAVTPISSQCSLDGCQER